MVTSRIVDLGIEFCQKTQRYAAACSMVLLLLALQGCIAIPIPVSGKTNSGNMITTGDQASIKVGSTTRDEIVQRYGTPDETFDGLRVIVYEWQTSREWITLWMAPFFGGATSGAMDYDYFVDLIAFDSENRLVRIETKKIGRDSTLMEVVYAFAKVDTNAHIPTNFVPRNTPSGQSLLYVYRPDNADDSPTLVHSPQIYLDGKLLGELGKGNFILSSIAPGSHQVTYPNVMAPDSTPCPSFETLPDQDYFVEFKVQHSSRLQLEPTCILHTESEALPQMQKLYGQMVK